MDKGTYDEAYKRYRSELAHEDNLINQRLHWFLVAQGFLFAALGVSLQKNIQALGAGAAAVLDLTGSPAPCVHGSGVFCLLVDRALYAAILKEIQKKGEAARFRKTARQV